MVLSGAFADSVHPSVPHQGRGACTADQTQPGDTAALGFCSGEFGGVITKSVCLAVSLSSALAVCELLGLGAAS